MNQKAVAGGGVILATLGMLRDIAPIQSSVDSIIDTYGFSF